MTHEESVMAAIKKALPSIVSVVIGKGEAALKKSLPEAMWREIEHAAKKDHLPANRDEIIHHMKRTADGNIMVGGGSGFLASDNGLILTNKHVVADADAAYTIITAANDTYPAHVLARDPLNDVAILKIEDKITLPPAELGNSNEVVLGQTVIALGNALGEFQNTVSAGIISGLSRFITAVAEEDNHAEHLRNLIQTDAAINPGNSGGPLVNLRGEVIGINAAVVYGAENIGFAIPINKAKIDLENVLRFGRIRRPFLGFRYVMLTPELKNRMKLKIENGVLVMGEKLPQFPAVMKGSPADAAGIQEGDIILSVDGKAITEQHSLEDILENANIGDALSMKVLRPSGEEDIRVTLAERK